MSFCPAHSTCFCTRTCTYILILVYCFVLPDEGYKILVETLLVKACQFIMSKVFTIRSCFRILFLLLTGCQSLASVTGCQSAGISLSLSSTHTHTQHGTLNSGPHRRISGRIVDVSKPPPVSQVSLRDSKLQDSDKDNVELQDKYDQDNELAFVGDHQDSKVDTGMEEEGYQREGGLQDNQLQDDAGIAQQALESKFDGAGEVKAAMGPPSDIQSHESEKETKQAVPRKQPPGVVTITKDEMKKQAEAAAAGKKELQKKSQPPGIVTMTRDEVRRQAEAAAASKVESQKKPQQAGVITISKSELKKQQERPPSPKPVANQRPIQQVRGAQPNQGALVSRLEYRQTPVGFYTSVGMGENDVYEAIPPQGGMGYAERRSQSLRSSFYVILQAT